MIAVASAGRNPASDPLNVTYSIGGLEVTLKDGCSEVPAAPNSATKIRTTISGRVVQGDLDHDGDEDAALLLTHAPGGSGTFYYVAVAENLGGRYRGSNGVLLGDRIVPKDLRILRGLVIVFYTARRACEPMSTTPSIDKLMSLVFDRGELTTVGSGKE
jgi:hypothetical protein